MFIKPLSSLVTLRTRVKGVDYFRSGGVIDIAGGEWSAHAIVRGTRDYRVDLRRESGTDRFTASCECPYYADRGEICKHIWAALLEADRRGLLGGDGAILPSATLEPEYRPDPDGLPVATTAHGLSAKPAAKTPAWERFLNEVQQDAAAAERARPAPRFSNGEIVYSIDVRDTLNGYGTVINVLFRQRRKNGTWSKPQAGHRDAERGGTPGRRCRPRNPFAAARRRQPLDRTARPTSRDSPARVTCSTDRSKTSSFRRLRSPDAEGSTGLTMSPVFSPSPGTTARRGDSRSRISVEGNDSIKVDGRFVRDGEWLEASRSGPAVESRLPVHAQRDGAPRRRRWIRVDRAAAQRSVRFRCRAPSRTRSSKRLRDQVSIPARFRPNFATTSSKARRVRACESAVPNGNNPYALRQDLRATVQFDYDGAIVEGPAGAAAYDRANRRLDPARSRARSRPPSIVFTSSASDTPGVTSNHASCSVSPRSSSRVSSTRWCRKAGVSKPKGRPFRPAVSMRLEVSSGIDWFDLHGAVDFGDGRSAPFPQLLAAVARGEDVVVLDDGSVGLLPEEWLRRYAAIAGFGSADGDSIRFGRSQVALLDALLAAQPAIAYDETFARVRSRASQLQRYPG